MLSIVDYCLFALRPDCAVDKSHDKWRYELINILNRGSIITQNAVRYGFAND